MTPEKKNRIKSIIYIIIALICIAAIIFLIVNYIVTKNKQTSSATALLYLSASLL
jgi:hypothetical protein